MFASLVIILVLCFISPDYYACNFVKDIYSIGINVLAIIFSIFFASLAIIISSGDNDFIKFIEEDGLYTLIVDSFKFSIMLLFIALLYSIVLYGVTANSIENLKLSQNKYLFFIFIFLFSYSLFAATESIFDSIKYAKYRIRFLMINKE